MVIEYSLPGNYTVRVYDDRIEYVSPLNDIITVPKNTNYPPEKEINGIKHYIVSIDADTLEPIYGFVKGNYLFEYNGNSYTIRTESTEQKTSTPNAVYIAKFLDVTDNGVVYVNESPHKILICCGTPAVFTIRGETVGIYALPSNPKKNYTIEELRLKAPLYKTPQWFKLKRVLFSSGENGILQVTDENNVLTTFVMKTYSYMGSTRYSIDASYGCMKMTEKQPSKVYCLEEYSYPSDVKIDVNKLFKLKKHTQIGRAIVTTVACIGCRKKVKAIKTHLRSLILFEKPERELYPWEKETIHAIINGKYTPYTIAVLAKNGLMALTNYTSRITINGKEIFIDESEKVANFGETVLPRKNMKFNNWPRISYSNGKLSIGTDALYPISFVKKLYSGEQVKHTDILPNFPENESFRIDFRSMQLEYSANERTFVAPIKSHTDDYVKILHPAEDGIYEIGISPGDEPRWGDLEWVKKFPKVSDFSSAGVTKLPKKAKIIAYGVRKIIVKTQNHEIEYDDRKILVDGREVDREIFDAVNGDLGRYLFVINMS